MPSYEKLWGRRLHGRLRAAGLRVLNNPPYFRPPDSLLTARHAEGLNEFTCCLPAAGEWPLRYPVFLRTIAAHRGALTELRPNRAAAGAALARAIDCDCLILDLIFVEYAAERQPDTGGFQKHAAFRAGPHIIRAYTASDVGWMAKTGSEGVASKAQYRAERDEMDHCPHRNSVMRVFEFAGLQFGRLYFDIVAGRPQAYDINTNPSMTQTVTHPNATRRETMGLVQSRLASALADLTQRVSRLPW